MQSHSIPPHVDGVATTLPLHRQLIREPDIVAGDYDIHWLENYLARSGA